MIPQQNSLILDKDTIKRKLRRMAYEIYERNADQTELILAGIYNRGKVVALLLETLLKEIAPLDIRIVDVHIDHQKPTEVKITEGVDFDHKVVILVDDVANSGRTLLYAMKPLLDHVPLKIQTAVLVDRTHKSFPVVVDYTGHSLSTTLQENILVGINGDEISGAYLS
jgi:pyrimidine operon attenuation protein/uracil phosphoribosyltransferase